MKENVNECFFSEHSVEMGVTKIWIRILEVRGPFPWVCRSTHKILHSHSLILQNMVASWTGWSLEITGAKKLGPQWSLLLGFGV